jgi:hypothetical protein
MLLRNTERLLKGLILMKAKREPMSSRRFCIGVPVRHQRDRALIRSTVLYKTVDGLLMMWAVFMLLYAGPAQS